MWKTFEEQHGSQEDVKKVQGMMPIVAKRRHVDEDTGQVVEGMSHMGFFDCCVYLLLFTRLGYGLCRRRA